ncbi:MAG: Lnb N-terminal periplasmic domain-containing protein, partial [Planctomycetota bacterium]
HLDQLRTADLFLIYWGPELIAHTIISFGFEDGTYVAISIETRKEKGEEYSAIKGFFKQFELTYVVADERDVVRLRSNYRKEDVYLYRLQLEPKFVQEVFLDYFKTINRLTEKPKWYNALTHNCTTTIRGHSKPYNPNAKFDWRMLANGLIDQMMYERGVITNERPFDELRKHSLINDLAQSLDQDANFSHKIRKEILLDSSLE